MRFCVGDASLIVKNTFIGSQPECEVDVRKRSSSAPAERVCGDASRHPVLLAQASLLTGYKASEETEQKDQREPLKMGIIYLESGSSAWSEPPKWSAPQSEQGKSCAESDCNDEAATTKSGGTSHSEDSLPAMEQSRIVSQSLDSVEHDAGNCRPCAWFWKKGGCYKDNSCGFCHMCPDGEVKRRKQKNRVLTRLTQVHTTGSVFQLLLEKALPLARKQPEGLTFRAEGQKAFLRGTLLALPPGDFSNSKAAGNALRGAFCKYAHAVARA